MGKKRKDTEYNWLDDPFDKKKDRQIEKGEMDTGLNSGQKTFVGAGCALVLLLFAALAFLSLGFLGTLAEL